jgi:hypothetical protein
LFNVVGIASNIDPINDWSKPLSSFFLTLFTIKEKDFVYISITLALGALIYLDLMADYEKKDLK